ncbi:MAG: UbiA family prenyltransferase [Deltaproteobacteria bacterium]|nr:UbiA family prenyltransferase [Deltaproteobacteria bacterium]
MAFSSKVRIILEMIKFEHTIFALPFAYLGMVLGADGKPRFSTFVLITIAMVGARSYAMALNRIFDRTLDKKNPRTASRALPMGLVSVRETVMLAAVSLISFLLAIYLLPPLCRLLWPLVIIPMSIYSLTKRFTWLCHIILGLCLGLAPLGAWIATTNTLPPAGISSLGLAVVFWTAGFDIIYSCQDYAFDQHQGLYSIPARFGLHKALIFSKIFHGLTVAFLLLMGLDFGLGPLFYGGIVMIAGFLWYENHLIKPDDLSKITMSFFTLNGFVSIFIFAFTYIALMLM